MGSKCKLLFSGPPEGTSLCETTSFDVLIVKIGVGVLAVGCRKNKKLAESHDAHFRIFGGTKGGNRSVIKLCMGVGVSGVITQANLGAIGSGVFEGAVVEFPTFRFTCVVVSCDIGSSELHVGHEYLLT